MLPQEESGLLSPWVASLRYRMAAQFVTDPGRLLDVGCGAGAFRDYLSNKAIDYYGIDIQQLPQTPFPFETFDICTETRLRFDGKEIQFDYICLLAVIEHVHQQDDCIRRLLPYLKKGGILLFTTPTPASRSVHEIGSSLGLFSYAAKEEHTSFLDKHRFEELARDLGLRVANYIRFAFYMNQLVILRRNDQ